MIRRAVVPFARAMLVAALLVTFGASRARAQAFVPAKGEGSVSFLYQDQFFRYHYLPTQPVDIGQIWARSMLYDITYGLTDKIAVSFRLPGGDEIRGPGGASPGLGPDQAEPDR